MNHIIFHRIQLLNLISGAYKSGFSGNTGLKGSSCHVEECIITLICSIASEVIKVMQLVEVADCKSRMGTQGCDGAVPAASAHAQIEAFCLVKASVWLGQGTEVLGLWNEFLSHCEFLCNISQGFWSLCLVFPTV